MSLPLLALNPQQTELLVEYDKDTEWERYTGPGYPNGPIFTIDCPDENPKCEDKKVHVDPILHEEFSEGKDVIILENGHVYNPVTLARWLRQKKTRRDIYNSHDLTDEELQEIGINPKELVKEVRRFEAFQAEQPSLPRPRNSFSNLRRAMDANRRFLDTVNSQ